MPTAKEFAQHVKKTGDLGLTSLGIKASVLSIAQAWRDLPADQKANPKVAEKLIQDTVTQNFILKSAGTVPIVQRYMQQLVEATYQKDDKEEKTRGFNLIAYMNESAKTLDTLKVSKDDVAQIVTGKKQPPDKLESALGAMGGLYFGFAGKTLDQDFKDKLVEKDGDNALTKDVQTRPQAPTNPLMMFLVAIFSSFLGVDLTSMFGNIFGEQKTDSPSTGNNPPPGGSTTPSADTGTPPADDITKQVLKRIEAQGVLQQLVPAATNLADLKSGDTPDKADLKALWDAAKKLGGKADGENPPELTAEQAKKLGDQVLADVMKMQADLLTVPPKPDTMTPEKLGSRIVASFSAAKAKDKAETLPAPNIDFDLNGLLKPLTELPTQAGQAVSSAVTTVTNSLSDALNQLPSLLGGKPADKGKPAETLPAPNVDFDLNSVLKHVSELPKQAGEAIGSAINNPAGALNSVVNNLTGLPNLLFGQKPADQGKGEKPLRK